MNLKKKKKSLTKFLTKLLGKILTEKLKVFFDGERKGVLLIVNMLIFWFN